VNHPAEMGSDWSSEHLRSRNGMLASPEPVEAFTFTFNLSQVGTLKIRGTFRAKNRQQPHPSLAANMMVEEDVMCREVRSSASFCAEH